MPPKTHIAWLWTTAEWWCLGGQSAAPPWNIKIFLRKYFNNKYFHLTDEVPGGAGQVEGPQL